MMERGEAIGLVFVIFGATLFSQVLGVLIDCTKSTCTPLSGTLTLLFTIISMLTIIFGLDRIIK